MDAKGWMIFRVLVNRFHPKGSDAVLKFLPDDERQKVLEQDVRSSDLMPILCEPQRLVAELHYSWINTLLEQFPKTLRPLVIAALGPEQRTRLSPSGEGIPGISAVVKDFFIDQLYMKLDGASHLPIDYLPVTELSPLIQWKRKDLLSLVDYLGLHDLAVEVRHIVDKVMLQQIYACLTPKQLYYLNVCLHQKEQLVAPRLGITLKMSGEELKKLLHSRGLLRLGRAMAGQHPDLLWHLCHLLDTGRGEVLRKCYQEQLIPTVTPILKGQVLNIMNFLKKE